MRRWLTLVVAAVVLGGCATPGAAVRPDVPTYSPRREALAYFPRTAPLVAVVRTDPQDPGLRRVAGSGALAPLQHAAAGRKVFFTQLRGLLGNDAVVGLPHPGARPLAALVTQDGDTLATFARARVLARTATRAGTYRGAKLYVEPDWAFAVRDEVLLVGGSLGALTEALDTRVGDEAFEAGQLNAVLPGDSPPATFVRAYVDLQALVNAAGPVARAVPLLAAMTGAGVKLGASDLELIGTLNAPVDGAGLTSEDVPVPPPARGRRPALPDQPAVAVADLAPVAAAAERALSSALPVSALKLAALRERLRAAGVALRPELLRGPAVIAAGPVLRLDPRRPAIVEAALERAAKRLGTPRLRLRREGPLYSVTDRDRTIARVGMVGGVFVAGRAPAKALLALARGGTAPLLRPALARLPRASPLYPRPVVLTFAGGPRRVRIGAFSGF